MPKPSVIVIFCEDIRSEIDGKKSFIGCFTSSSISVSKDKPFQLPKVIVNAFVQWDGFSPPDGWQLRVETPTGESGEPFPLPPASDMKIDPETGNVTIAFQATIAPFIVSSSGNLSVFLEKNNGEECHCIAALKFSEIPSPKKRKSS
ncbi:hypothetical protein [Komagataeibacter rhaeticus]|uniref:hypothetical protein n=1 Tax=Komagataeibacter rhaeticus TaxID=215221 RepID=UPI0039EC5544